MTRPRAADDFGSDPRSPEGVARRAPRARRDDHLAGRAEEIEAAPPGRGLGRIDERYRDRAEGAPPPWVPTIF